MLYGRLSAINFKKDIVMQLKDTTAPSINPEQPMHDAPVERHVDVEDARQGETPNVTRKVLTWGLVLVVIAFAAAYVWQHMAGVA